MSLQQSIQHDMSHELGVRSILLAFFLAGSIGLPLGQGQECTPPFSKGPVIPSEFPNCPAQECVVNEGLPDEFRYSLYDCFMESFDEPNRDMKGETTNYIVPTYVTIPEGVEWPMPLLVMLHPWTYERNFYINDDTTSNEDNWNTLTFARKGYAVLTLTARGHYDLVTAYPSTHNPQAKYWSPVCDPGWDVRDVQTLIGKLVDAGLADPERIGVTGNSYGGGIASMLAMLNDKIAVDYDENTKTWATEDWRAAPTKEYPDGVPLSIRAVVPRQPWTNSFIYSMAPNGRMTDAAENSKHDLTCPFGVPLEEWWDTLFLVNQDFVQLAPPGVDPSADFTAWYLRIKQGEPYDSSVSDGVCTRSDETIEAMIEGFNRRSAVYYEPNGLVPIYQVFGMTDSLVAADVGVQMIRHLKSSNPNYPVKTFFGNLKHHWGPVISHWQKSAEIGYAFLDYYMLDVGDEPSFDITVATTVCDDDPLTNPEYEASMEFVVPDWDSIATSVFSFSYSTMQTTINPSPDDPAFNPYSIFLQAAAGANCMTIPAESGPGAASWDITMPSAFTLIGSPRLTLSFNTDASDVQLNAILWKLSSDELEKTLVTYGAYRHLGTPGKSDTVTYQILANAWEFDAGTTLRLEIRSDARPHFKPNNAPATTVINSVTLSIPGQCNSCLADLNCDGIVNVNDLLLLISNWGTTSAIGDLNLSGSINVDDLLILIGAWGPCT